MTIKNKNILKRGTFLFIVIFIILFYLNSFIIYGMSNVRFNIIKQIDYAEDIDILMVGNSHAQEGINAQLMSEMINKNVYNFSFSQQESAAAYYFLENIFKKHSPKTVVVEAYTLIQKVEGAYDLMPLSFDKVNYYNMLYGEANFNDVFFPITRLHNFWSNENAMTTIKQNVMIKDKPIQPFFTTKIMSYKAVDRHKKYNSDERAKHLIVERLNNILKIKHLCEKNDADLVLTMLPWYKTLVDKVNYNARYYDPIKDLCIENDIPYFDMNIDSDKDWDYYYFREQDYTQNTHLNAYGQHEASCELAYYLASTNDDITITGVYPQLIKLKDYLRTIDTENDILIIDKCPMPIDYEVFLSAEEEFKRLNITPSQELGTEVEIQYISGGAQYNDYENIINMDSEDLSVTIYELDTQTKEIISHAVIRWDVFDTLFIR